MDAFNTLAKYFTNPRATIKIKMNIFMTFVTNIFLYNSELWTLTEQLRNKIDTFQRILLRRIINVKRADRISNQELYETTKTHPWSIYVKRRRLNWLGHLLRLPDETPAKQALEEYRKPTKKPRGKPKTTWMSQIKSDMNDINITFDLDHVTKLANDRAAWRSLVKRAMSNNDGKRV
jgi:hypothetical protein